MARRRRKKGNPLLAKVLLVAVAVHAIALPIAAHYGAFKEIQKQFGTSKVVMVTLPPVAEEKKKAAPKAEKKPASAAKKSSSAAPKATAAQKAGLPQPKVVASTGPADGAGGDGPTVDANAAGIAGKLPTGAGGGSPAPAAPTPQPAPTPAPQPQPKPEPAPVPAAKPEPAPTPKPEPAPVPKPRRIVEAVAESSPEPTIPDDLRGEPFEKTLVVEADVDTGGHPTNVRVAETTGVKELDDAGLDAARRYRFKPATIDDAPVDQHVRFRIIFKVE